MGRRTPRQTFAEVLREIEQTPAAAERPSAGGTTDPDGTSWLPVAARIDPGRALSLAAAGARVAWDPCGCGGYCGFDWFSPTEVARLVAAGIPVVRNNRRKYGSLSEWASEDGRSLVVAEAFVRWADLLD